MVIEKTYKLEILGRILTLSESEAKALYLSLKDSFKEVDITVSQPVTVSEPVSEPVSQPSQASQLPSESWRRGCLLKNIQPVTLKKNDGFLILMVDNLTKYGKLEI